MTTASEWARGRPTLKLAGGVEATVNHNGDLLFKGEDSGGKGADLIIAAFDCKKLADFILDNWTP